MHDEELCDDRDVCFSQLACGEPSIVASLYQQAAKQA